MTVSTPTTIEKIRALPWSLAAGAANSVFAQFIYFGPVFVLFLSDLNISSTQIGFLLSLLPFMGLIALFVAPHVARFGYKRTFITFYALRKAITLLLLLVPWVMTQFGSEVTLAFVAAIVIGFGLSKSISETGFFPWVQEVIPRSIRGKYTASNHIFASLTAIGAVSVASYVLGLPGGLERYQILFVAGVVFGVLAVWLYTHVPGGSPHDRTTAPVSTYRDLWHTAHDRNLLYYLAGVALIIFGTGPLFSFLPLFMNEQIGLSESQVVLLSTSTLIGGLVLSNLLGWSADRYGSKPVMIVGIVCMMFLPVGWLILPRANETSLIIALVIAFFQGFAATAWMVGSGRLLFVSVVPDDQKGQYMAVYYAAIGVMGGTSQLVGGALLDAFSGISGQLLFITLDRFTPLILAGIVLPGLSLLIFRRVRADSQFTAGEYAGMFIQGNPILALESLVRFYRARDEHSMVVMTERLGLTHSPLTVEELLEALTDPRFNVRYEAIISMARMQAHPRLTKALTNILLGTELSLSNVAAWALGRIGDPSAIPVLRTGLDSNYHSVRMHCARALGTLKAQEVTSLLHERLQTETDKGLQMAYAAALGNLQATESIETLYKLCLQTTNEGARIELALSLARIVGQENLFVNLLRQMRSDAGTTMAQELLKVRRRLVRSASPDILESLQSASDLFAAEDMVAGGVQLATCLQMIASGEYFDAVVRQLLQKCADDLAVYGSERVELLVLVLHVLHTGVRGMKQGIVR
ncbi:MAG: MFS transporter [Aggregatilineales bacterium]